MGSEEVVKNAEKEVVEAAVEWVKEASWQHREMSPAESKLKMAVYMLSKARTITGSIRIPDDLKK